MPRVASRERRRSRPPVDTGGPVQDEKSIVAVALPTGGLRRLHAVPASRPGCARGTGPSRVPGNTTASSRRISRFARPPRRCAILEGSLRAGSLSLIDPNARFPNDLSPLGIVGADRRGKHVWRIGARVRPGGAVPFTGFVAAQNLTDLAVDAFDDALGRPGRRGDTGPGQILGVGVAR